MAKRARRYWLMKSEPDVYSIEHLKKEGQGGWDGVRNYRARNFMRDEMEVGDLVLFYHSSTKPPGVAGVARVCGPARPDPTQFDPRSKYHDPASSPDEPRWHLVDVEYVETLPRFVTLDEIKGDPELEDMWVTRRGMRLSIQPVDKAHFKHVLRLGKARTKVR